MSLTADRWALLAAWDVGTVLSSAVPATGTINQTLLVTTTRGDYALRAYRHRDREPVAREHAAIAHVRARGLPAVAPLPLPDGATILERAGRYYALFPRAPGVQVRRAALGAGEAVAMGTCLGRLHHALQGFPLARAAPRSFAVDRELTLERIARLEAAIRARDGADPLDAIALRRLAGRRAWLVATPATARVDFTALEQQVVHGDYQESNLFFTAGRVSAIIDWDQTHIAPRAWEVARTLHLAFGFAPALCGPFLDAYRAEQALPLAELDRVAAGYSLLRAHDLWVYEACYFEGNERVRAFIAPGDFVPLTTQWAGLRAVWPADR